MAIDIEFNDGKIEAFSGKGGEAKPTAPAQKKKPTKSLKAQKASKDPKDQGSLF